MGSTYFSKRYNPETSRCRKKRAKTFKTEEAAKKWAEENGMKDYKVVQMTYATQPKFRVE